MKNQALFSSNHKSAKFKCRLLQFLFGSLKVNTKYFKAVNDIIMHLQLPPDKTGMII